MDGNFDKIEIDVKKIHEQSIIETKDSLTEGAEHVMLHMPIKKTNLPERACIALGADGFLHYKRVILRQIEVGSLPGGAALAAIRRHLPDIYEFEKMRIPV